MTYNRYLRKMSITLLHRIQLSLKQIYDKIIRDAYIFLLVFVLCCDGPYVRIQTKLEVILVLEELSKWNYLNQKFELWV